MIIVKITGGPGNQLFQYAAGKRLAYKHHTVLKLDIAEFEKKKHRKFILDKFKIKATYASWDEIKSFYKFSYCLPELVRPPLHNILKPFFKNIAYEKHFHFDNNILSAGDNIYLVGFWQSEKYFLDIEEIIREEFELRDGLAKKSQELLRKIKNTNSVSISIRRGDFVSDHNINQRHGVLDLSYYKRAIDFIVKNVRNPHFFIFSDDMLWVKENIKLSYPSTCVDINLPHNIHEDLILGSYCQYNIIANSTFSWWVAWLNNNKEKIVIAPQKWFNQLNYNTKDLIPKSWLRF